jgi:parallel beta-helix repeat protein
MFLKNSVKTQNNGEQTKSFWMKSISVFILVFFLLFSTFPFSFSESNLMTKQELVIVPQDYSTIQEAINAASEKATIFVKQGIYYENLVIDKPLSLSGEDKKTLVMGSGGVDDANVFCVKSDNVKIFGFTIKSLNYSTSKEHANGIKINGNNISIHDNLIENTFWGILCPIQSFVNIYNNTIRATFKEGIRFYGGNLNLILTNNITENAGSGIAIEGYSNTICGNKIVNNKIGIGIGASYSLLYGNNITQNSEIGIYFSGSSNIISANWISDNKWGIYFPPYFSAPNNNKIYNNNFFNNEENVEMTSKYNFQEWDNDLISGGNYWNDYLEKYPLSEELTSNTEIMNTPYEIFSNTTDMYPLAEPFEQSNSAILPTPDLPATSMTNEPVALWHFDEIEPNDVTLSTRCNNHAILGTSTEDVTFTPKLVDGMFGNALQFNGYSYLFVPASPSLEILSEITIDAWIKVDELNEVEYNNIVVQSVREGISYPTRIVGLAVNGKPANGSIREGALRGYVVTEFDGLNEIVTKNFAVEYNKWTHVTFTRSLDNGMQIFVDGKNQEVRVTSGKQNPSGNIKRPTYLYIGHDSKMSIDELVMYNTSKVKIKSINDLLLTLFFPIILLVITICLLAIIVYRKKTRRKC